MRFSCPRRVEHLGSTAFALFGWGIHRHEFNTHSGGVFNFNVISLVRDALLYASCSSRAYTLVPQNVCTSGTLVVSRST